MTRRMLDTNIVSLILRQQQKCLARLAQLAPTDVCISVITEAELRYGLAKRPHALALAAAVSDFLHHVDVLEWTRNCAARCASLLAAGAAQGKSLAPYDLMIAAHALATDHILVSTDLAFAQIAQIPLEAW
jgi:tRNA(fMet)-specific endonuclease VapC